MTDLQWLDEILDKYGYWEAGGRTKPHFLSKTEAKAAIAAKLEQVDVASRVDEQNKLTAFIGNNSGQPNFLNLVSSYNSERYAQLTKKGV